MSTAAEPEMRTITVGADGSASAEHALRWAALEARRIGAALRIVHAWTVPPAMWTATVAAPYVDPAELRAGSQHLLDRARSSVRRAVGDDVAVTTRSVEGSAAPSLIAEARDCSLLVVGSRGRGTFVGLVLGSVATTCAHDASVPIAIVRKGSPDPTDRPIVVGIDDSDGARRALRWALDEGRRTGASIRAVHGWDLGPPPDVSSGLLASPPMGGPSRAVLEDIIDREVGLVPDAGPVELVAAATPGAELLVAEAAGADLLVVGARGHGGFTGLLLGSVSQKCLHHAPCTLVIVPACR